MAPASGATGSTLLVMNRFDSAARWSKGDTGIDTRIHVTTVSCSASAPQTQLAK